MEEESRIHFLHFRSVISDLGVDIAVNVKNLLVQYLFLSDSGETLNDGRTSEFLQRGQETREK